jgi:periplasmic protein TonB
MVFLSITIHVLMLSALVVASIVAPDILPSPRDVLATPVERIIQLPEIPVPPTRRQNHQAHPPVTPLFPPEGLPTVDPEPPVTASSALAVENDTGASGDIANIGVPGGNVAPPAPPPPPEIRQPVRPHSGIAAPKKVFDVAPVYPAIARAAGVSGIVILEVTITAEGDVADARVLRSIAALDQAALDAVRRWKFTATRLNGEAIPVVMTVTVNFQLNR